MGIHVLCRRIILQLCSNGELQSAAGDTGNILSIVTEPRSMPEDVAKGLGKITAQIAWSHQIYIAG